MYTLSWAIRIKPDWQRKASDPEILSKWRQEALDQQSPLEYDKKLTEEMVTLLLISNKVNLTHLAPSFFFVRVDYILAELAGYAKIADNTRGIERGCFDAIWYSDRLISDDVTERLKIAVSVLENLPDSGRDWHPGSNEQVLDLVHPSLYCIVYDRTHAYDPHKPHVPANFLPVVVPTFGDNDSVADWSISSAFCWLPSDFSVGLDGSALYCVIEEILGGFIPMFDRRPSSVIWGDEGPEGGPTYDEYLEELVLEEGEEPPNEDEWYDSIRDEWKKSKKILPEAVAYEGQLEQTLSKISLRGRTIQCIVKLANIHLTPDRMANEHIVASGIYYYDEENITEARLSFRVPTQQPEYHAHREDHDCVYTLYGFASQGWCVQELGEMITKEGRTLSWPNQYQHRVSPLQALQSFQARPPQNTCNLPGRSYDQHIPSATAVPPQQAEWASTALQEAHQDGGSRAACLPQEVVDLVKGQLPTTFMTLKEAEEYRLALMEEHTVFRGKI
ncbi:hypothetical protein B0H14DRAFT_3532535 [Mycena olivaceomarginata]|nr:hypothetical protein B0H14DRAFT_3532535 [Mycena olivaceomarginata]